MSHKTAARSTRSVVALGLATLLHFPGGSLALAASLTAQVIDAQTREPIHAATVRVAESTIATQTDADGRFRFDALPDPDAVIVITHVGYQHWRMSAAATGWSDVIALTPLVLHGQDIVVTGNRARRGESPVAFENVSQREIAQAHYAQDVPMLLAETPGVYAYSDNGNGIGYSYLSIRGFSQRRVSVLINGVPLNDPESHEVYWIDLPDLPENTQDIQVQRGVGTTLYGSNSIGGTINVLTDRLSPIREIRVNSGFGSYDTRKFSVALNSGLIDDRHGIYGRFSRIVSEGYRDNAWTDLWSYFFSAARYDEKWTNRINIFGGPEQTHLAYKGVPRWYLNGDTAFFDNNPDAAGPYTDTRPTGDPDVDRRYNPFEWSDERDNFNQPHYQLLTEYRPGGEWTLDNTLYYVKGKGFYEQLRRGQAYEEYGLTEFASDGNTVDEAAVLTRRRWVENDFWGVVPRATWEHPKGTLTFGAELRHLRADHWGQVTATTPAPPDFIPGEEYYRYAGRKTVVAGFAQEVWSPIPELTVTGAMQLSFKRYQLLDDQFENVYGQRVSHTTDYTFASPRVGLLTRPTGWLNVFGSVSLNRQEPSNDEIFDAGDYWANAGAFFGDTVRQADGTIEGSEPLIKAEELIDVEFGAAVEQPRWRAEANLFYMDFSDEIVWNGRVNEDGIPIRTNAPASTHKGIEFAAQVDFGRGFTASGNFSINENTFDEFTEYVADWDTWIEIRPDVWAPVVDTVDRAGNTITSFPENLLNLRGTYENRYFMVTGRLFRSGVIFLDNSNASASVIAPYTTVDVRGEVNLTSLFGYPGLKFYLQVNNLWDEEYETGGYADDGFHLFIPAAKRNFFAGLRATL